MKNRYLNLVLPTPMWQTFDYLPLPEMDITQLKKGIRIKVPFGKKELIGIYLGQKAETEISHDKLKPIISCVDTQPLIPESLLDLFCWASDYYHYPLGEIIFSLLPKKLRTDFQWETNGIKSFLNLSDSEAQSITLNEYQTKAVDAIKLTQGFQTYLLAGITGSGKTEVYFQVLQKCLDAKKQAIVLIPEIALTPQTVDRFKKRFSVNIAVMHSGLTDKERLTTWLSARTGEAQIIIGTRSAIFTPLLNPGIMIIDEEHDASFKQQSGFRYSARDLANVRAQLEKIPLVLGSATPSLESLYNVERKRYHYLELPKRAGLAVLPHIKIINLCGQKLKAGLSQELLQRIEVHLKQEGQVLLFLNRRGYAPILMCHQCGYIVHCRRCDAKMTLHQNPKRLQCHHCDATRPPPLYCEKCQRAELISLGLGTERIEKTLQEYFMDYPIIRIDRDSAKGKGRLENLIQQMHDHKSSILIGTQMLAKGHHLPNLTLVAVVDADSGLLSTDFRAIERLGQLLVQVSGRAGREQKAGEVYIQTHQPEHPLLQLLLKSGYSSFAKKILNERKLAELPPFQFFALLRAEAIQEKQAFDYLDLVRQWIETQPQQNIQVAGPIPAPMERRAGKYRAQLLIQSPQRSALQAFLKPLSRELNQFKNANKVRWSLDVDPMEML